MPKHTNRINKYYQINTKLSYVTDARMQKYLSTGSAKINGLRSNIIFELDNDKIFCKKIRITKLEHDNMMNTSNMFDLPLYYNYGVGSEGINCFRELLVHIKTTNFVLDNKIENFPLMYHYRFIKDLTLVPDNKYIEENIAEWNSDKVGTYLNAKYKAEYAILIFLEYIPLVVSKWLDTTIDKNILYVKQIIKIIKFLRENHLVHFDAHVDNILTDGKNIYLTDFGLAFDSKFKITDQEKKFYRKNTTYDYSQSLSSGLINGLRSIFYDNYEKFEKKYNLGSDDSVLDVIKILLDNIDDIAFELHINKKYINLVKKYKHIIIIFETFIDALIKNKSTVYPNDKIKKELFNICRIKN